MNRLFSRFVIIFDVNNNECPHMIEPLRYFHREIRCRDVYGYIFASAFERIRYHISLLSNYYIKALLLRFKRTVVQENKVYLDLYKNVILLKSQNRRM